VLFILAASIFVSTETHAKNSGDKNQVGLLLSAGYGRLETTDFGFTLEREKWHAFALGAGLYWGSGRGQIMLDLVISNSRKYKSEGWIDREGSEYYLGLVPRLRHRIFYRFFANIGYGFLGPHFTGGPFGTSSDLYPVWTWGGDFQVSGSLLIGFQLHNVLAKEGHEKPDWELLTFHLTFLLR